MSAGAGQLFSLLAMGLTAARLEPPPPVEADHRASPSFSLQWRAPIECPSTPDLLAMLEEYLGRPLLAPLGHGLRLEARVEPQAEGWWASLSVHDDLGSRRRDLPPQPTCLEATQAIVLVMALTIDPSAPGVEVEPDASLLAEPGDQPVPDPVPAAPPEPPDPAPEETPPAAVTPPRPERVPPAPPAPVRRPPPRMGLGAFAAVSYGALPGVGPAVGGHVAILWSKVRLSLDSRYFFVRTRTWGSGRIAAQSATGTPQVCAVFAVRTFELMPCAGLELGVTIVNPYGLENEVRSRRLWAAWRVAPTVAWAPIPRLALLFGVEAFGPFARGEYFVGGLGVVHREQFVGVRGLAGLEVRLP